MNILIVEDEEISRMALDALFSKYGSCQSFATGPLAIEAFESVLSDGGKFDLMVLDISLEHESGVDVLKKIRTLEKEAGTAKNDQAVIFMATVNSEVEIVKECIRQGCNDYILKPLNPKVIEPKMKRLNFKLLE